MCEKENNKNLPRALPSNHNNQNNSNNNQNNIYNNQNNNNVNNSKNQDNQNNNSNSTHQSLYNIGFAKLCEKFRVSYQKTSLFVQLPFVSEELFAFDGIPSRKISLLSRMPTLTKLEALKKLNWETDENIRYLL